VIALMPNPRFELTRHGMRQSPSGVRFAHFTPLAAFRMPHRAAQPQR
jgi:hypothetical protein